MPTNPASTSSAGPRWSCTRTARPRPAVATHAMVALVVGALLGCGPEKPPAPSGRGAAPASAAGASAASTPTGSHGAEPLRWQPEGSTYVLTHVDERGAFADAQAIDTVPERARGLVRVVWLEGPTPPPGQVWVTNLRAPLEPGVYGLQAVARDAFEELALGAGASSVVRIEVPEGLEPPPPPVHTSEVIVYKTEWCGVCRSLTRWLDARGVNYVAKDIEKDEAAVAELATKAKQAGVKMGSVPMIDVGGQLLVGFDREALASLLDAP